MRNYNIEWEVILYETHYSEEIIGIFKHLSEVYDYMKGHPFKGKYEWILDEFRFNSLVFKPEDYPENEDYHLDPSLNITPSVEQTEKEKTNGR